MRSILTGVLLLAVVFIAQGTISAGQIIEIEDSETQVAVNDLDRNGIILEIGVGDLESHEVLTQGGVFTLLSFPGCVRSQKLGEPNLPLVNRLISVPFGSELRIELLSYETEEINLSDLGIEYPLLPVQPSVSKSDDPASIPFEYDAVVYEQAGFYSLETASVRELGTMRSVHLGLVSLSPVEYNPLENVIRVYKSLTVQVTYEHPDWFATEETWKSAYSPVFEPLYSRICNYEQQATRYRDDLVNYPIKYVIISDRAFESQLQPFIEWKTKKGFYVVETYTDVIGSTPSALNSYLDSMYTADLGSGGPTPSFLLIVGDDNQIPAYDFGAHISDLYACEFTGDVFPEIYYGRFSAQNPAQLQPQIDKTLEYEQYLMPDPSYLGEVTLIAGVDGTYAITHGNGQINYGTNLYFNAAHGINPNTWLYPASDQPGASAAIIQTVNDGIGLINYTAHCGHTGHSDPSFTTSDVNGLTNEHKYCLGIGNCCLANTFGSDYGSPCMGEAWLQKANGGGIGYIGGTNSTYWDEDYWWGVGYGPVVGGGATYEQTGIGAYDGIFHDHGEPTNLHYVTNDAIIFAGNMAVTESGSSRTTYYWQIYHLMGDPSVMSYMGVPTVNPVVHPSALVFTSTTVDVTADPGSYFGVSMNGVLHGAGYVDASGTATINLDAFSAPGTADIVVTCQNREPYVSTIDLFAPDGPYVVYASYDINDPTGNNNGLVDVGESVLMGLNLKNVGPDDALNVEATIATSDPLVSIVDGYEAYGTITGNEGTSYIADGYAFSVSPATPDKHNITFDLTVSGTNRDTWVGTFVVPVHAPNVVNPIVAIDDASGNSNGILDPGETVDITVTLTNTGSGQAIGTDATITESHTYVTVSDDYGYFGLIDSINGTGSNATDVYTVSADAACPMGDTARFTMSVSADGGYSANVTFDVVVGDRVVFFYDDFSFDQGWTGLGGSGEWTIGPAVGGSGSDGSGGPDPSNDHSPTADNQVLGNDLTSGSGGDYAANLGSTYWVYSPIIDCFDFTGVKMAYFHWLGVESPSYDHAYFEVYNGVSWVRLYENGGTVNESSWTEEEYDLSAYADENPDFQIRFGIGPTDGSVQYCGWNVDDITLKGYNQSTGGSPVLAFLQNELGDSLLNDQTSQMYLRVYNNGDGNLRIRFNPNNEWITCSTDLNDVPPGDSLDFPITIDASGMAPGDHTGSVHFTCNDYLQQSGDIPVQLHVFGPELSFSPPELIDSLIGGDSDVLTLRIYNTGLGNLNISFTTTDGWLDCGDDDHLVPPNDSLDCTVTCNSAGMAPGDHVGNLHYTCDYPEAPEGDIPVLLHVYVPACDIPQSSIEATVSAGEQTTQLLTINNTGPGRLSYSVGCQAFDQRKSRTRPAMNASLPEPLGYRPGDDDKSNAVAPYFAPVDKGHGGPDLYGYSWIDSDDPGGPAFIWVDISSLGTPVTLGDDSCEGPLPIGFPFQYYDSTYTELYIGSNGIITFSSSGASARINTGIPTSSVPNDMLAVWWDDLDPEEGGNVYYYYDAGVGRFIVSYVDVRNYAYPSGTGSLSFQVILYPNGKITMQYATMDPGSDGEGLSSATVGIENAVGDDGLQVAYNAPYMHNNLAIDFTVVRWLWVEPGGGIIEPFSSASIDVHLDATELGDGTYDGQLSITTNDPVMPSAVLPVSLQVQDYICGDVNGNGAGPNVEDLTYLVDYLFKEGPPPPVLAAANVDGIGGEAIDVADLSYLVDYLFRSGPEPVCQ